MVRDHSGHGSMSTLALTTRCEENFAGDLLGEKFLNATVPCFLFGVISESDAENCCSHLAGQVQQALEANNEDNKVKSWE